ncbi:kinase-like domain-containing protein [Lactarius akahatsu]|uniref:Kinase-like domain-containing protein n=1 Tax=Lactarius akahatsu TaxID=416441 RepID=A0AAD4LCX6_9AGAM|nr:kinase-like domain-containing protein [Lactarius akahatsu]
MCTRRRSPLFLLQYSSVTLGWLTATFSIREGIPGWYVWRKRRRFRLSEEDDRVEFALELYNLVSLLENESENDDDTRRRVKELTAGIYKLSQEHSMPTFADKTKCTGSDDGENQSGPSTCPKGDARGTNEQLEACGYKVIPVVFETDGGTWELISDLKLPPHICTVYRRSDPNKTELIAKQLRDGSNELDILKHIHTIQPKSPHVISLIEAIPSITGGWLILPKLHSIRDQGFMDRRGVHGRNQLGRGLIKGLAYLHEHRIAHRDVKPDNLVCDDVFRLQIIDFDVAIEVQDENTEVDEYRGTKDWTAPEIGKEDGPTPMYSPIKADRWSCGRVLLRHMMVGKGDNRLSEFAEQLMANDPQQRPSLLEWDKWSIAPFSVAANALVDRGKEPRPRQDMVEESMKPPDAKKPRLVSD